MYAKLIAVFFSVVVLAGADDAKGRVKLIRDLAKGGGESIPKISPYLSDPEVSVRLEAVKVIVDIDTQRSLDPLIKATSDNDPEIQIRAAEGLINFYQPGYSQSGMTAPIKRVGKGIKGKFVETNDQVIDPFVQVRPDVIQALGKMARGGSSMESRANAARGVGILRGREAVPDLIEAVKSKDGQVIYEALIALEKIHEESAGPAIAFRLHDTVEKIQLAAIEATGILQNKSAMYQVRDAMDRSKSMKIRHAALTTIAMLPDEESRGFLKTYLTDKDDGLRTAAIEGIGRLRKPSDRAVVENLFSEEKKGGPRLAAAFAAVTLGNIDITEFAPLKYIVNNLNSQAYRGVARAYLTELARDGIIRQQLYLALHQSPTNEEKIGLAQVFAASGDRETIPYVETISKDPNPEIAKEGQRAVQTLHARLP